MSRVEKTPLSYARGYINGMVFGISIGMGLAVALSMIAWAMHLSVAR